MPEAQLQNEPVQNEYAVYRALSGAAVTSLLFGVASVVVFVSLLMAIVPILGIATGIYAIANIRRREHELTGTGLAWAGILLSAVSLVVAVVSAGVVYATEVPEGYTRVSYVLLQPEEGAVDQLVPPAAHELEGEKVFIKGYLYPGRRQRGITEFLLVRDQGDCCFGGNPRITDRIQVRLAPGLTVAYHTGLYKLAGTFHVDANPGNEAVDAGGAVYYYLDADHVR